MLFAASGEHVAIGISLVGVTGKEKLSQVVHRSNGVRNRSDSIAAQAEFDQIVKTGDLGWNGRDLVAC
jgi:hypothetical protein